MNSGLCPICAAGTTRVIDTSKVYQSERFTVYRRRKCNRCGHRFTTYELPKSYIEEIETKAELLDTIKSNAQVVLRALLPSKKALKTNKSP